MIHDHKLDESAKRLVEENRFLVHFTIRRYIQPDGALDDDDISDGYTGLCQAAATYDSSKGKFSGYAVRCILNEFSKRTFLQNTQRKRSKRPVASLNELVYTEEGDGIEAIQLVEDAAADTERDALNAVMREQGCLETYWQEVPIHDAVIRDGKMLVQIAAERGRCKQLITKNKKIEARKFRHKYDLSDLMEVFA